MIKWIFLNIVLIGSPKPACFRKVFWFSKGSLRFICSPVCQVAVLLAIPEARTRLWAVLLNAKLTEAFISQFPENWKKGKYGRVIFRWEEVQLLIKKLNNNSKPSYIPTLLSDSIINQEQQSLFADDEASKEEPILIFGYTKDALGQITNPRIVYFNGKVEWVIDQEEFALRTEGKASTEEINVSLKQKEKEEKKAE